jgi:predicted component of type VI protein secretion system
LSVDEALLIGRAAFLVALYLFLLLLVILLWRELRVKGARPNERAPADLMIVEPFDTGLDPGERIPLLAESSVGRGRESDILLDDSFLSADHARLSWNGRGWVLEDLNSTNGTKVNGKPVKKPTAVKSGDLIEFGRVKVKLIAL